MVWDMEGVSGIPKTTIHHIITEYLIKKKAVTWWVPHILFPTHKTTLYRTVTEIFDPL